MARFPKSAPRIGVLLGKPVPAASVLAAVLGRLRAVATVTVHLPLADDPLPEWLADVDLIVQRGLSDSELNAALQFEDAGVRCCNRVAATIAVWDRVVMIQTLSAAGAPVPSTALVGVWPELVDLAERQPLVVKAIDGAVGRGLGVLIAATGRLPPAAPFPGPFIAQEYVPADDRVHKVYVAGSQTRGLIKRWPRQPADELGEPFTVDRELDDLSRLVGTALGLEIYGVDVLYGPKGPVVVDVNPFPSFTGVPEAAQSIADYVTAIASGHDQPSMPQAGMH